MKSITGIITCKETGAGVGNLVVTAYDSKLAIRDLLAAHPRTNALTPQFMDRLGKRIGSVLSDSNGRFTLASSDLHFEGVESRPDLLLAVFAPEDITDERLPFVLPPEERILYISAVPRMDAGAEEVYVIRLLQTQLDRFQITTGAAPAVTREPETASKNLFNSIDGAYQFKDNLKEKLHPRLKAQHEQYTKRKESAVKLTKNLSAIPKEKRDHPYLLTDKTKLSEMQEKSIADGLHRLKKYKPAVSVSLNKNDLKTLGLKIKEGEVTGKVTSYEWAQFLAKKIGGVNLIRRRNIDDPIINGQQILDKYLPKKEAASKKALPSEKSVNSAREKSKVATKSKTTAKPGKEQSQSTEQLKK